MNNSNETRTRALRSDAHAVAMQLQPTHGISRRGFLTLAAATAACATRRSTRTDDSEVVVPLVYDAHGSLFVEARVNGREPKRLILDTGASRSTISSAYAAELGLVTVESGEIEGSAGVVAARQAPIELEVMPLVRFALDATVYDFTSYDARCVGIAGYELLSRAPFQIRYAARELRWTALAPARTIAMQLDGRIPRIQARVQGIDVPLRIDTGASLPPGEDSYLNLTERQARDAGLEGDPVAVFTASGTGGAKLELPVHRLDEFEIAGRFIERAFAIVQPPVGYFAREDAVGFLGNSVLDKLDPYFDYQRGVFGACA